MIDWPEEEHGRRPVQVLFYSNNAAIGLEPEPTISGANYATNTGFL